MSGLTSAAQAKLDALATTLYRQRDTLKAGATLAAPLLLAACAANPYAGIPLTPGAADPVLQDDVRRAMAGDKHAQLALGVRYEEGNGVPIDYRKAKTLYRLAVADSGGTIWVYSPAVGNASYGRLVPVRTRVVAGGLSAAKARLKLSDFGEKTSERKSRSHLNPHKSETKWQGKKRAVVNLFKVVSSGPNSCHGYSSTSSKKCEGGYLLRDESTDTTKLHINIMHVLRIGYGDVGCPSNKCLYSMDGTFEPILDPYRYSENRKYNTFVLKDPSNSLSVALITNNGCDRLLFIECYIVEQTFNKQYQKEIDFCESLQKYEAIVK